MTTDQLHDLFDRHKNEFLEWDKVTNRSFQRADLHALALLDRVVPNTPCGTNDMISGARHDEIFLAISPEELAAVATEEQVVELIRCGVLYDRPTDSLYMFV